MPAKIHNKESFSVINSSDAVVVNAMSVDALATKVASAWAGMVFAVEDRQHALFFQS